MADAVTRKIADLMTARLNQGMFSMQFTAERTHAPEVKLEETGSLKVLVCAAAQGFERQDRSMDLWEYEVHVGVLYRPETQPPELADVDLCCSLVEEVLDLFRKPPGALLDVADVGRVRCMRATNEPLYDLKDLRELGQFTAVVGTVWQAMR